MRSSILATIPGFRQRIIPEPRVPSRGSQARGTRLLERWNRRAAGSVPGYEVSISSDNQREASYGMLLTTTHVSSFTNTHVQTTIVETTEFSINFSLDVVFDRVSL